MILRTAVLCAAAALAGCANPAMQSVATSWQGATVDEVFKQWGYAHEERTIAGRKILVWHEGGPTVMAGSSTATVTRTGGNAFGTGIGLSSSCTRMLEIRDDRVVGGQIDGNSCPFIEIPPYTSRRR